MISLRATITSIFLILISSSNSYALLELNNKKNKNYQVSADKINSSYFFDTAVIQGLDKTIAKTSNLKIKIGENVIFGNLEIIAHRCWQAPLAQKPESKILLEIFETTNSDQENKKRIFYGWIFASSPSISGLEHPIYDLTAISCINAPKIDPEETLNEFINNLEE